MAHIDDDNILHILDRHVKPGKSAIINFNMAKLYTTTNVDVPIIIQRSEEPGPVVLITGGLHGDEVNGVEVVRQLISKEINIPKIGTTICIPVLNVFGFLNMNREFPDGRDLNRVFPGFKNGSLASRLAYQFTQNILPIANYCLDFHTGGASRFNAPQIRVKKGNEQALEFAKIFNAPFTMYSKTIPKSYRETCAKKDIPILLFEGGKSQDNNKDIAQHGVEGAMRFLNHLGMLREQFRVPEAQAPTVIINSSTWIRARYSGLLHTKLECGKHVEKGEYIATITDPYGQFRHKVKTNNEGYIINVNQSPIVYQGDAIFHISTSNETNAQAEGEDNE